MAVRKKTDTIHVRVEPLSKALLEAVSNFTGRTATQIIEALVKDAASKIMITEVDDIINDDFCTGNTLDLETAVKHAQCEGHPILTKLKTFFIAEELLSARERIIYGAVIRSTDIFSGSSEVFTDEDIIIKSDELPVVAPLDLEKISDHMPSLEQYAVIREKNPNWKPTYSAFLATLTES